MFANALPESLLAGIGKIYEPRPLAIKSRKELLSTIRPQHRRFLRADNGDMPAEVVAAPAAEVESAAFQAMENTMAI